MSKPSLAQEKLNLNVQQACTRLSLTFSESCAIQNADHTTGKVVLLQGCNCYNTQGAGFAKALVAKWPQVLEADKKTLRGDRNKLGTFSRSTFRNEAGGILTVLNMYTQFGYGKGRHFEIQMLDRCLHEVAKLYHDHKIIYPLVGGGLGGGNILEILTSFHDCLYGLDHELFLPKVNV